MAEMTGMKPIDVSVEMILMVVIIAALMLFIATNVTGISNALQVYLG